MHRRFFQLSGIYALMAVEGTLAVWSRPWWVGVLCGMSPVIYLVFAGNPFVLGERWPCTNCALFPWSEEQVKWVMRHLGASSKIKMVLTTMPINEASMVGLKVTSRGQAEQPEERSHILHNVYGNLWNWTKVYPKFVKALNAAIANGATDATPLVQPVRELLRKEQLLVEVRSALPLLYAHVVELDLDTGLVVRVLA